MKASEIDVSFLKCYLRIDGNSEDVLLQSIVAAAHAYAQGYTGLSMSELEQYEDIPLAILALCADMYDVRQATVDQSAPNLTTKQILDSHSINLL